MTAIVATDQKNGIGFNNRLLCHLPDDLKYFKNITLNNVVIMGRKTYESIGKPLPNRVNIVLSKNLSIPIQGIEVYEDINSLLKTLSQKYSDKKIFIIGGAQIYQLFYPYIREIRRTLIHHFFEADTFFPSFENDFELIDSLFHPKDEKHPYSFEFQRWIRK